ncbi:MAG: alcohol dehydrogenase catalytic domain-containing protein [Promethearchaeota archaeon]
MKAAVYYKNSDIKVEEVDDVPVGKDEIKVRVKSCGVCGSDVMEWYRIKRAGKPGGIGSFGHESTGDIEEIGESVDPKWKVGDRVVFTHHVSCNTCNACFQGHTTACKLFHTTKFKSKYGAYAEYVVLPAINVDRGLFKLPKSISYDAGTFIEPVGCVIRGQQWANVGKSKSILIIGAGISGILHAQIAKINGAGFICVSDININRLKLAKKMGVNAVINANLYDTPTKFKELNGGFGADVVIMTAPSPICVQQSFQAVGSGGTILFFTSTKPDVKSEINLWNLWQNEITITHSYGADSRDLYKALRLIENGRVNTTDMITHRFPLEKTSEGFMLTANPKDGSLKVIIHPNE